MVRLYEFVAEIVRTVATCPRLDLVFPVCSHPLMDEAFKIVKVHGGTDEVLARIDNSAICKAAFAKALFV